jgi:alkylation response protein AidB-like acyl-CoA dehydrogenase
LPSAGRGGLDREAAKAGEGYRKGRPIERIWREIRVIRILEGTSEVMRNIVARELLRRLSPNK